MKFDFSAPFSVTVPGKWVLSGEHSVLRGCPAVALPHPQFSLTLTYEPDLNTRKLDTIPEVLKTVMDPLLEKALRLRKVPSGIGPTGKLSVESSIPLGSGLGSSAALCVATTLWLGPALGIPEKELQEFATELENSFHGKSSGMDIAICLAMRPLLFTRGEPAQQLNFSQLPEFEFVDTGVRCSTRECILKVEEWMKENAAQAFQVDQQMANASRLAHEGLTHGDLEKVRQSMDLSWSCYQTWGLLPPHAEQQREQLLKDGALAVKLTGAGLGGYLVALYDRA